VTGPASALDGVEPAHPVTLDRVDHVAIAVYDADATLRHLCEVFGLRVIGDEIADEPGVRLVYFDGGGTMIQLVEPLRSGPVRDWLRDHGEGLHHVCFAVRDIEEVLAGIPGEVGARVFAGGRGRRACFLAAEPANVKIELTEHEPSS
jgi:methylmalonyl-CoA epimerase